MYYFKILFVMINIKKYIISTLSYIVFLQYVYTYYNTKQYIPIIPY